ncbi:hypothetical protein Tco_0822052 [Tanacetum coccineum]|uniref:Uncharacterized protein n=1 Tax=Tanacetum coccineum TaxID=301880 RepID=A0ABQ5AI73_9ASTR
MKAYKLSILERVTNPYSNYSNPLKLIELHLPEGHLSPIALTPSTASQPQALEIGENSSQNQLSHVHKEQIQKLKQETMVSNPRPGTPILLELLQRKWEITKSLSAVNLSTSMVRKEQ